mmetsp:Transcript_10799/g.20340  ORF Transcript_10799/g.20340 Transcript_10799/m.20340 type:complete len:256 (-) Transcript_10799:30-797(-)
MGIQLSGQRGLVFPCHLQVVGNDPEDVELKRGVCAGRLGMQLLQKRHTLGQALLHLAVVERHCVRDQSLAEHLLVRVKACLGCHPCQEPCLQTLELTVTVNKMHVHVLPRYSYHPANIRVSSYACVQPIRKPPGENCGMSETREVRDRCPGGFISLNNLSDLLDVLDDKPLQAHGVAYRVTNYGGSISSSVLTGQAGGTMVVGARLLPPTAPLPLWIHVTLFSSGKARSWKQVPRPYAQFSNTEPAVNPSCPARR